MKRSQRSWCRGIRVLADQYHFHHFYEYAFKTPTVTPGLPFLHDNYDYDSDHGSQHECDSRGDDFSAGLWEKSLVYHPTA